jgi:uncharacterized protein (DUF427 family)
MKAIWQDHVIAESAETIELDGYRYFLPDSVRMELLQVASKTDADHRRPHGVQFFNVSDETHSSERAAWRTRHLGAPTPGLLSGWGSGTTSS